MIGLGGNTPGTLAALTRVRVILGKILLGARFSSLFRTAPQLDAEQDFFWNAAAVGDWTGTAESLLERLLMLESREGRLRDPNRPKGPRVLDLDLLVLGQEHLSTPRLRLPHPELGRRRFALEPLLELEPEAVDPRTRVPWSESLLHLPLQGVDRTDRKW